MDPNRAGNGPFSRPDGRRPKKHALRRRTMAPPPLQLTATRLPTNTSAKQAETPPFQLVQTAVDPLSCGLEHLSNLDLSVFSAIVGKRSIVQREVTHSLSPKSTLQEMESPRRLAP